MKCADCLYYWRDELDGDDFPRCHCGDAWLDNPPCEEEDEDFFDEEDKFEPEYYNYDEMADNP